MEWLTVVLFLVTIVEGTCKHLSKPVINLLMNGQRKRDQFCFPFQIRLNGVFNYLDF